MLMIILKNAVTWFLILRSLIKDSNASAETYDNASGNNVKSTEESSYEGSHYSNEAFYKDLNYVDDDQMEYALLQSHLDDFDILTGIEVSIPWATDDYGNNMNSFTGSASTQCTSTVQNDPNGFPSWNKSYPTPWHSETEHVKPKYTSGDSLKPHIKFGTKKLKPCSNKPAVSGNVELSIQNQISSVANTFPKASMPNGSEKPPAPPEHVLDILMNHISIAPNNFPEASMPNGDENPLTPENKLVHSSENYISSAAYNFPKALMLIGNEKRLELNEQVLHSLQNGCSTAADKFPYTSSPTDNGSMGSNVDLSTEFPGYNFTVPNSSTAPSYIPLFPNSVEIQKDLTCTEIVSSSSGPSCSKSVNENPDVILKKLDLFKKFDTVEDYSDHLFSTSNAFETTQPARSWAKKIQDEWRILENDLPDTIFVRVYESRMDLLRAAIIGAEGTPYHDGLFFFDMFFPSNYPNVPPKVLYHSRGLRINPNLYKSGIVCLSLLNTWNGSGKEKWIPGESTVLQVLVSIQGLILNEKPYFNEPGYEDTSGTVTGEKRSVDYNEKTLIYSLKTMVYSIKKPPKHFEELVVGHFSKRANDILAACRAYKDEAQVGSVVVKGGVANVNNKGQKGNSKKFKKDLAGYLKRLVEAFLQVGVKDCEKFLN